MKYILILLLSQIQLCRVTPVHFEEDRCNDQCYNHLTDGYHNCDLSERECMNVCSGDSGINDCIQRCSERHDNCIMQQWEQFDQCLGRCDNR